MKVKSIISIVLFIFLGFSIVYLYVDSKKNNENSASVSAEEAVENTVITPPVDSEVDSQSDAVAVNENKAIEKSASVVPAEKQEEIKGKSVDYVYYFMTAARCPSCMKIEAFTKEAVNENFVSELKKGTLKWEMISVEDKGNEHYIKDYELYTKSVVLVKMKDDKQVSWKNLDKVWQLLGDKDAFKKYINDEVTSFIGKG